MNSEPKDGDAVTLDIHGSHNAAKLDALIRHLAKLRARLLPAVAVQRDALAQTDDAVLLQDQPSLSMAALRGGGFRLWARHQGLGWLAYDISAQKAASIASLIGRTPASLTAVDLVQHEEPRRH